MLPLKSSLIHHSWCGAFSNFINDLLDRSPESQALQTLNSIKKKLSWIKQFLIGEFWTFNTSTET